MLEEIMAHDYRNILKAELEARCRHNPCYSLRAFARDLKIAPSRLSEILNNKQGLSQDFAMKIATLIGLSADDHALFCDSVAAFHARSRRQRQLARARLQEKCYGQMEAS